MNDSPTPGPTPPDAPATPAARPETPAARPETPAARAATPHDLELLPALEAAADELFLALGRSDRPLPPPGTPEELAAARAVLVVGDPPRGFVRVEEIDGTAHIEQLSVHPDHGRRGLGALLLEAACTWARDAGHTSVTLTTFADVPWNAPFYSRHGFRETTEHGPQLGDVLAHERAAGMEEMGRRVLMRRDLTTTV